MTALVGVRRPARFGGQHPTGLDPLPEHSPLEFSKRLDHFASSFVRGVVVSIASIKLRNPALDSLSCPMRAHQSTCALAPFRAAVARASWNEMPALRCACTSRETAKPCRLSNQARSQYANSRNSLALTISSRLNSESASLHNRRCLDTGVACWGACAADLPGSATSQRLAAG